MKKIILAMVMVVAMATGAMASMPGSGNGYYKQMQCEISDCNPFSQICVTKNEIANICIIPSVGCEESKTLDNETAVGSLNRSVSQPFYAVVGIVSAPLHLLAIPYKGLQTMPSAGSWTEAIIKLPFEIPATILASPLLLIEHLAQ